MRQFAGFRYYPNSSAERSTGFGRARPHVRLSLSLHIKTCVTGTVSIVLGVGFQRVSVKASKRVCTERQRDQSLRLIAGASSSCSPTAKLFLSSGSFTINAVTRTNRMTRSKFPRSTSAECNQGRKGKPNTLPVSYMLTNREQYHGPCMPKDVASFFRCNLNIRRTNRLWLIMTKPRSRTRRRLSSPSHPS